MQVSIAFVMSSKRQYQTLFQKIVINISLSNNSENTPKFNCLVAPKIFEKKYIYYIAIKVVFLSNITTVLYQDQLAKFSI